jgi:hypothetical protein
VGPLDRFLKIENQRPDRPGAARPDGPTRFTDLGDSERSATEPGRSGGEPERFAPAAEKQADPRIRIRVDDDGQPFIRCRVCRYDNPLGSTACTFCEADLTTPAQRSYNEALWDRHLQERVEYRQEAERIEAERRKAEAAHAAAMGELRWLRLGQIRWAGDNWWSPFAELFRDAGRVLARWLVRRFPDRRERLLVVGGALVVVNLLALWWVVAQRLGLTLWLISLGIQLVAIARAVHRARRG